jgi:hypothetical protein
MYEAFLKWSTNCPMILGTTASHLLSRPNSAAWRARLFWVSTIAAVVAVQSVEDVSVLGAETDMLEMNQQTAVDSAASGEVLVIVTVDNAEAASGDVEVRGMISDAPPPSTEVVVVGTISTRTTTSDLTWGEVKRLLKSK